jgi:hypothetical protein
MSLTNVVATDPTLVNIISSDADLTLQGVNLALFPTIGPRVNITGAPTQAVDPKKVVDCSNAYVPFPSPLNPNGTTWQN